MASDATSVAVVVVVAIARAVPGSIAAAELHVAATAVAARTGP